MDRALPTAHHLLPYEKWVARWGLSMQRTHRTPRVLYLEKVLGPEGITLRFASQAGWLLGMLVALTTIGFLFATNEKSTIGLVPYPLLALTGCICALSLVRARQSKTAGYWFRKGYGFDSTHQDVHPRP